MKTAQDQIWSQIKDQKYVTNAEAVQKAKGITYYSRRIGLEVKGVKPQTTLRILRKLAEDEKLLKVKGAEYVTLKGKDRFKKKLSFINQWIRGVERGIMKPAGLYLNSSVETALRYLDDGELAIITDKKFVNFHGNIVVKVYKQNAYQILGSSGDILPEGLDDLKCRRLNEGELIEVR